MRRHMPLWPITAQLSQPDPVNRPTIARRRIDLPKRIAVWIPFAARIRINLCQNCAHGLRVGGGERLAIDSIQKNSGCRSGSLAPCATASNTAPAPDSYWAMRPTGCDRVQGTKSGTSLPPPTTTRFRTTIERLECPLQHGSQSGDPAQPPKRAQITSGHHRAGRKTDQHFAL